MDPQLLTLMRPSSRSVTLLGTVRSQSQLLRLRGHLTVAIQHSTKPPSVAQVGWFLEQKKKKIQLF